MSSTIWRHTDTIFAWKCFHLPVYICLPLPPASRLPPVYWHSAPDLVCQRCWPGRTGPATLVFRVFKAMRNVASRVQTVHQGALLLQRWHSDAVTLPGQSGVPLPVQPKRPDRLWSPHSLIKNINHDLAIFNQPYFITETCKAQY